MTEARVNTYRSDDTVGLSGSPEYLDWELSDARTARFSPPAWVGCLCLMPVCATCANKLFISIFISSQCLSG